MGSSDFTASESHFRSVGIAARWPTGGTASVKLFKSSLGGKAKPRIDLLPETHWQADGNQYDLAALTIRGVSYTAAQWDSYRQTTGQDANSTWRVGRK
jgi:hypothetical protein